MNEVKMRMLCTRCWRTARPDTRLGGSDRAELAAWLCLGLPGALYCWWRLVTRRKVCSVCGSHALVREARAARRARQGEVVWYGGGLGSGRGAWPGILGTPSQRLVHGGFGALLFALLLGERLVAGLAPAAVATSPVLPMLACAGWLAWQGLRAHRLRSAAPPIEARDEHGRPLPIEAIL